MPRINGGLGFGIEAPNLQVKAKANRTFSVSDRRKSGLDHAGVQRLLRVLQRAEERYGLQRRIAIEITGGVGAHYGFGTGTASRLACLEALLLVNGHQVNESELIRLSGRGGTSGIGIHVYFHGGLVIDLGRKSDGEVPQPSSQAEFDFDLPLLLQQTEMPLWEIGICIPSHISPLTEEEEKVFFHQTCPIPETECYRALYHGVAGVFSAARERDRSAFGNSVHELQECAWKRAERTHHGQALSDLEDLLYALGASVVGMSSLGPALFFLADQVESVVEKMRAASPQCELMICQPSNTGRRIECSS